MNSYERKLHSRILERVPELAEITPGLVIEVHSKGRKRAHLRLGETYTYYDLASLTKILFTASSAIAYFSSQPAELRSPIRDYLPWWKHQTTPIDLLTHTAGLAWWKPYYKSLKGPMQPELRWNQLLNKLKRVRPSPTTKAVYSDLDLWMLGAFLEGALGRPLLELWQDVQHRLKLGDVFFHPGNKPKFARKLYAPTEDCAWRKRVLQGEVHDENTWSLAGVAPHAGLFGSIEAVSDWGLKLRAAVLQNSTAFGDPQMVRHFVGRRISRARGDWGLGFMKPSVPKASCGRHFSRKSFGHTGFTGTSLWMDPVQDLLVVILSNRVYPTRANTRFQQLRAPLHDWICELL